MNLDNDVAALRVVFETGQEYKLLLSEIRGSRKRVVAGGDCVSKPGNVTRPSIGRQPRPCWSGAGKTVVPPVS
jgi:hypothetical protein